MVALGGSVGASARYLSTLWVNRYFVSELPIATLTVNIVGSFFIGLLMMLLMKEGEGSHHARLLLVTGMLGGFTTFSSFSWETWTLIESGRLPMAIANIFLSVVICLIATFAGIVLAKQLT